MKGTRHPVIIEYKSKKNSLGIDMSGKAVFFSCVPSSIPPQKILDYFQKNFGPVAKLGVFKKPRKGEQHQSTSLHRGSGFVNFVGRRSVRTVLDEMIHYIEGALFNIRFACTRKDKQAREAVILAERRLIHIKGAHYSTFPRSILSYLQNFGKVTEFIFIPNNSAGEISCFAVFAKKGISDYLDGQSFRVAGDELVYRFVKPLSEA